MSRVFRSAFHFLGTAHGRRRAFVAVALFAVLPSSAVASGERPAPPLFHLETLTVEGARTFRPELVLAESRLRPDTVYTEKELGDAMARIVRMPWILDADFSLRKGSAPGLYELIISVVEARRWFFGADVGVTTWSPRISVDGLDTTRRTVAQTSVAGYRWPAGPSGLLYATVGGAHGTFQLGFTRNDLFGRNARLSVEAGFSDCSEVDASSESGELGEDGCATEIFDLGLDPVYSTWSFIEDSYRGHAELEVPLRGNHSLRLLATHRKVESGLRRPALRPTLEATSVFTDRSDTTVRISWLYATLDDPALPTSGLSLEAGIEHRRLGCDLTGLVRPGSSRLDSRETVALFAGDAYRPLSARTSVGLGATAFAGHASVDGLVLASGETASDTLAPWGASASLRHGLFLIRRAGAPADPGDGPQWRELRWENELGLGVERAWPELGSESDVARTLELGTGLAFRNTWGLFRLRATYVAVEGL